MPQKRKAKKSKAKKSVRKKVIRKKKAPKKSKGKKKTVPLKTPDLPSEPIGHVTHYFSKARAAAILIEREGIRVGDTLYFKGHTTNFKQKVESLQIERQAVSQAGPEDEVGLRVRARARENDLVFKL